MHEADKYPAKNTQRRSEDIVFIEADAKQVHHPHTDTLVITVRVANSNVHIMLVDNGSVVNILYWDVYKKTGLIESDLNPTNLPPLWIHWGPRDPKRCHQASGHGGITSHMSTVMAEFLVVDCLSAFNGVIGRLLLKALKAVVSIYSLTMKFSTTVGIGQVRERQYDSREC